MPDGQVTAISAAEIDAALEVVRKADAYRLIETGQVHRALGLSGPLPSEIEKARAALDAALAAYEVVRRA